MWCRNRILLQKFDSFFFYFLFSLSHPLCRNKRFCGSIADSATTKTNLAHIRFYAEGESIAKSDFNILYTAFRPKSTKTKGKRPRWRAIRLNCYPFLAQLSHDKKKTKGLFMTFQNLIFSDPFSRLIFNLLHQIELCSDIRAGDDPCGNDEIENKKSHMLNVVFPDEKCAADEFDCEDSSCIKEELKCDGQVNCRFRTDEESCAVSLNRQKFALKSTRFQVYFFLFITLGRRRWRQSEREHGHHHGGVRRYGGHPGRSIYIELHAKGRARS